MSTGLVDCSGVVPMGGRIVFNNLEWAPCDAVVDRDLLCIEMPGDTFVDVEWDASKRSYFVAMYREEFRGRSRVASVWCDNPHDVVQAIEQLVYYWATAFQDGVDAPNAETDVVCEAA